MPPARNSMPRSSTTHAKDPVDTTIRVGRNNDSSPPSPRENLRNELHLLRRTIDRIRLCLSMTGNETYASRDLFSIKMCLDRIDTALNTSSHAPPAPSVLVHLESTATRDFLETIPENSELSMDIRDGMRTGLDTTGVWSSYNPLA